MVVYPDFLNSRCFAEAGDILVLPCPLLATPGVVCAGNPGNVVIQEFAPCAVYQVPQRAGIDEQHLSSPVTETVIAFVARQKPQASGNRGRLEKLPGQGNHAIHNVSLNQCAAYLPLPALG